MSANRLVPADISSDLYRALGQVDALIRQSTVDAKLMELINIRASQINGCGFCLNVHSQAARKAKEDQKRLDALAGWRDTSIYTSKERAALSWTESVTNIKDTGASDEDYEALREHFSEKEIVDLTIRIGLINLFNRLAISMRYTVN